MTLENVVLNNGATGVTRVRPHRELSNTTITKNNDGIQMVGGTTISFGNSRIATDVFSTARRARRPASSKFSSPLGEGGRVRILPSGNASR